MDQWVADKVVKHSDTKYVTIKDCIQQHVFQQTAKPMRVTLLWHAMQQCVIQLHASAHAVRSNECHVEGLACNSFTIRTSNSLRDVLCTMYTTASGLETLVKESALSLGS